MGVSLNSAGVSHAKSLIASGKVSSGEWSFSGEDSDHLLGPDGDDWAAYGKWFLATDSDADGQTKAHYKFPFGKGGEVYTAALKAAEGRATSNGYDPIASAAKSLLADARPDDKKGEEGERVISDASEPDIVKDDERAADAPAETRDAKDGDPLPGEPGYDPDDDGDDDCDPAKDADDDAGMRVCRSGMAHARALIKAGKVDHGPFSFDAADRAALIGPNGTHTSELARHHLGTDDSQDDAAKKPAYPFAKDGRAYSRAFRSIARKAADAGHDAVAAAARDLMEMAAPPADGDDEAPAPAPAPKKKGRSGRVEVRDLPFTPTKTAVDGSYFEGYCAILDNIDEYGTIMAQSCFEQDLAAFRECGFFGGLNHDWDNPIGRPSTVKLDGKGLFVGGDVLDTRHGLDVRKWLAAGVVRKMSFGFDVLESRWLDEPDDVAAYWQSAGYTPTDQDRERARRGAMLFTRIRVFEASPVMVPGNQLADITAVRGDDAAAPRLTLEQHALAVLDAAGALCDRYEQTSRLRAGQGRSLARERLAQLARLRDRIDDALAACQPRAAKADVARLRRELFALSLKAHRPA